jgi:deoxycytidylate deaminase
MAPVSDTFIRKLAAKSTHQHKHAVVVERGGAILSYGYNVGWNHAEKKALGKLWPNKRKGVTVWSLRVSNSGAFMMAKPCPKCEQYLRENGVKEVLYSTNDGSIARMRL